MFPISNEVIHCLLTTHLPPGQNGCYFGRQQFEMHYLNDSDRIPIVLLTISQHWFWKYLGTEHAISRYLK